MQIIEMKNNRPIKTPEKDAKELQHYLNEANACLRDFLASLPLAVCDVSPTGMVANVNKAFEELSGFVIVEAVGQYLPNFFLEAEKVDDLLRQTSKKGVIRNQELTLVSKDKKEIPASVSFSAKKDSQGDLTGYFVSITDVSVLKELQQQTEEKIKTRTEDLEESRRALLNILEDTEAAKLEIEEEKGKTQIILDNFIDGLLIFSSDGKLRSINPKAEEFLNVKREEVLGLSMIGLEKIPQTKELVKIIKRKGKEAFREELMLQKEELVVEVTIQPIGPPGKAATDTLVIIHDITREKVIERLKSQFVSVAAHQLRTPLSIIKWSLSMLLEGELGALTLAQKEIISKTNQTNERMIRLINDLLNVARIEEGRFIYRPKTVDFTELLQTVIQPLKPLAQEKKVNFEVNLTKAKGSKVIKADTEKLALAMKNLIENAIFYTNPGGRVVLLLKKRGSQLEFSVQDTGIGIPKDQHDRVFSKFFRGDNAVRMETEGTGLGLFIAKNIIEAHGGKIWFESTEGQGTTFSFSLPVIG